MDMRKSGISSTADSGSYSDLNRLNQLKVGDKNSDANMRKVAQEFESLFLSEMLKSMRSATEALGKDNVFQLRALLTERAGFNLRNLYSHGLLTDDAVHNNGLFMLWWLLLRMTLFVPWGIEWHRKRMDDASENAAAGR